MKPEIINGSIHWPHHTFIDKLDAGSLCRTKPNGALLSMRTREKDFIVLDKVNAPGQTVRLSNGYPVIQLVRL